MVADTGRQDQSDDEEGEEDSDGDMQGQKDAQMSYEDSQVKRNLYQSFKDLEQFNQKQAIRESQQQAGSDLSESEYDEQSDEEKEFIGRRGSQTQNSK